MTSAKCIDRLPISGLALKHRCRMNFNFSGSGSPSDLFLDFGIVSSVYHVHCHILYERRPLLLVRAPQGCSVLCPGEAVGEEPVEAESGDVDGLAHVADPVCA